MYVCMYVCTYVIVLKHCLKHGMPEINQNKTYLKSRTIVFGDAWRYLQLFPISFDISNSTSQWSLKTGFTPSHPRAPCAVPLLPISSPSPGKVTWLSSKVSSLISWDIYEKYLWFPSPACLDDPNACSIVLSELAWSNPLQMFDSIIRMLYGSAASEGQDKTTTDRISGWFVWISWYIESSDT